MIQLPDFSPKHAAPKKELKPFILNKKLKMFIRTSQLTYNTIFADCNYCPFKLRIVNNYPLKCNSGRFCGRVSCQKLHNYDNYNL
jgi:hypothetical protein